MIFWLDSRRVAGYAVCVVNRRIYDGCTVLSTTIISGVAVLYPSCSALQVESLEDRYKLYLRLISAPRGGFSKLELVS